MLDPIVQIAQALYEALKGPLFLPVMLTMLGIAGYMFMVGNHDKAMDKTKWIIVGGALLLGAPRILTALQGVVKA